MLVPKEVQENICKECRKKFDSRKDLHMHLKEHDMIMAGYYTKHYPKYNLLTREPMPFKKLESYFAKDFDSRDQLFAWLEKQNDKTAKEYLFSVLKKEREYRESDIAPNFLDLQFSERLPQLSVYQESFGSYMRIAEEAGFNIFYDKKLPKNFFTKEINEVIQIDTREQLVLEFEKSFSEKLDYGDYSFLDSKYSVERKNLADLLQTLGKNLPRFKKEINRCVKNEGYMFIVVECELDDLINYNEVNNFPINLKAVYAKIRALTDEYRENIQFVFSGGREESKFLIPRLLDFAEDLKKVDLQYFISKC